MPQPKLIWNGAARDAFRLSFPITKTEQLDDGRLAVFGVATSEALDYDGEVIDYESAKSAFSAWAGNIREQHDPKKAVGRAVEVTADDDAKQISVKAFISAGAPDTQAKLLDGTLSCFSIGGKVSKRAAEPVTKADGSVVQAQRVFLRSVTETSVVDVGANPDSGIAIIKAVGDDLVWADGAEAPEAGDPPVDLPADPPAVTIAKGIWNAQRLIDTLSILRDCCVSAEWEQRNGEHTPEMLATMKSTLASLASVAQQYLGEEIAQMLAPKEAAAGAADDLAKAGRRFSAATKAALKSAHEACRAADKALAELGYDADDDAGDGEGEEPSKAAASAASAEDLTKAADAQRAAIDEIAKAAGLELADLTQDALTKAAITELVALRKTHAALLDSPAAPKGVIKTITVGKEADADAGGRAEPAPVVKSDGSTDDVATLVKAAQARPIRFA